MIFNILKVEYVINNKYSNLNFSIYYMFLCLRIQKKSNNSCLLSRTIIACFKNQAKWSTNGAVQGSLTASEESA